nr:condensation domain-containing protein [Pseudomonas paralcaligenes]
MQALLDSVKLLSGKERKALATLLKEQGINLYGVGPICPRDPEDSLALSYAQQRQWFLWQMEPDSSAYNIPTALVLKGDLDIKALGASFEALNARHETLRTTLRQEGDRVVQIIHPPAPIALEIQALGLPAGGARDSAVKALVESETRRPFDLEHGPLMRVKLLQLATDEHVLIMTLHHVVSDGWSMPILVDELVQVYQGLCNGSP